MEGVPIVHSAVWTTVPPPKREWAVPAERPIPVS